MPLTECFEYLGSLSSLGNNNKSLAIFIANYVKDNIKIPFYKIKLNTQVISFELNPISKARPIALKTYSYDLD